MKQIVYILGVCLLPLLTSGFTCPGGDSKEADPMSCRKFYLCKSGNAESNECGQTDTFDVLYRQCRAAEVVSSCSYAPTDCYIDQGYGFDYQGNVSVTETGEPCADWSKSLYSFNKYKLAENFCRNPNPEQYDKPWCPTNNLEIPAQTCDIPKCTGSSASFDGNAYIAFNTGTGSANSTYDLEASYEEQIMFYLRPTSTETSSIVFQMKSQSDDQTYIVKLFQKVIVVYAWLEAGGRTAKANTWIDLADGKSHKVVIRRHDSKIFLRVDNGPEHYSVLPGMTDKFMLPMSVEIGRNFKGCISSFDIITRNAAGTYRHYEPLEKLTGNNADEQIVVSKEGTFPEGFTSGCMLTPRFSEIMANMVVPTTEPPFVPPTNGTISEVSDKNNKELYLILACVIGAALLILLVVLVIVCRSRNKDKGVYKLKETKQFDWEYGNLPPTSKNNLMRESEHGV